MVDYEWVEKAREIATGLMYLLSILLLILGIVGVSGSVLYWITTQNNQVTIETGGMFFVIIMVSMMTYMLASFND